MLAPPLPSMIDSSSEQLRKNRDDVLQQLPVIDDLMVGMSLEHAESLDVAIAGIDAQVDRRFSPSRSEAGVPSLKPSTS